VNFSAVRSSDRGQPSRSPPVVVTTRSPSTCLPGVAPPGPASQAANHRVTGRGEHRDAGKLGDHAPNLGRDLGRQHPDRPAEHADEGQQPQVGQDDTVVDGEGRDPTPPWAGSWRRTDNVLLVTASTRSRAKTSSVRTPG
jgi:hypothetical protein